MRERAKTFDGVRAVLFDLDGTLFDRDGSLKLDEHLDVLTISETVGIRKPDPRIFRQTAGEIGVRADQCLFVGDHPANDVSGAISAGMRAVWKRTSYWRPPEFGVPVIDNISEITT